MAFRTGDRLAVRAILPFLDVILPSESDERILHHSRALPAIIAAYGKRSIQCCVKTGERGALIGSDETIRVVAQKPFARWTQPQREMRLMRLFIRAPSPLPARPMRGAWQCDCRDCHQAPRCDRGSARMEARVPNVTGVLNPQSPYARNRRLGATVRSPRMR